MLDVTLINKRLGCIFVGDCSVDGYPRWLEYIQVTLVFYVYGWWSAAAIQFLLNVYNAIFKRRYREIINRDWDEFIPE